MMIPVLAYEDALPEATDENIEAVADFLELRLIPAKNSRYRHESLARHLFGEYYKDVDADQMVEIGLMTVGDEADPAEAGIKIQKVAREVIEKIAKEYFDEFAEEARSWGWLE